MWRLVISWLAASDLRFAPIDEGKFKKGAEDELVRTGLLGGVLFLAGSLLITIPAYLMSVNHPTYPFLWSTDDSRVQYFSVRISQIVLVSLWCVLALLRWRHGKFKSWDWESIMVAIFGYCMAASSFSISWHVSKQWDVDSLYLWRVDCRNAELLHMVSLELSLTAASLFVPVRCCALWVLITSALVPFTGVMIGIGSPFPADIGNNVFILLCMAGLTLWGAHRNERSARERFRAQLQVVQQQGELRKRHTAVCHILNRFCDCVVHLGPAPEFLILGPNPRLAALLMHTNGQSLEGTSIFNYLASEVEHTRLRCAFQVSLGNSEDHDRNSSGEMISIRFKDIYGREFAVTASYTCIHTSDDEVNFIVGLAEHEERHAMNSTEDSLAAIPPLSQKSSDFSRRGVMQSDAVLQANANAELKASVTFLHDFEVLGSSDSFAKLCGPGMEEGCKISHWLPKGRNAFFLEGYATKVNELFYQSNMEKSTWHGHWILLSPTSRSCGYEIHADVEVTLCRLGQEGDDGSDAVDGEFDIVAQASLRNFKQSPYVKGSRKASTSRSSGSTRSSGSSGSKGRTIGNGTPSQTLTPSQMAQVLGRVESPETGLLSAQLLGNPLSTDPELALSEILVDCGQE